MISPGLGAPVESGNRRAQFRHQVDIQSPGGRKAVEHCILWKPLHFNEPFDGGAPAAQGQRPIRLTRDGNGAEIKCSGSPTVQCDLGFTQLAATFARREVEIVEADGSFEFVRARASQKHDRRVRIDSLDCRLAMRGWCSQEVNHRGLVFGDQDFTFQSNSSACLPRTTLADLTVVIETAMIHA